MAPRPLAAAAFALGLLALAAPSARADVLPPPERPTWDQHPPPLPDLPPEKELERAALAALIGLAVAGAASARWRRPQVERTS